MTVEKRFRSLGHNGVAVAVAVSVVLLVGVVAATMALTASPQPDLGDPVKALTCLPSDQILVVQPYGSEGGHQSPTTAVESFLKSWPTLSADQFAVDYSDGIFEQRVLDLPGDQRVAIIRLEKAVDAWAVSDFAACNALLVGSLP